MDNIDHKALIAAMNLLVEHVEKHLASGWEITITCSKEEAILTLCDPCGDEHEVHGDRDWSTWHEACATSQEITNDRQHSPEFCTCGRRNETFGVMGCSDCLSLRNP